MATSQLTRDSRIRQAPAVAARRLQTIAIAIAWILFVVLVFVPVFVLVVVGTRSGVVFEPLAQRSMRLVLEEFAPAVKLAEQIIKAGNDQDSDDRADEHAAGSRGADGSVADRPGAGGHDQRKETSDEGEGGHLNRPEAQFCAFDGRLLERHALLPPLDREFHDQDRVLAQQTDQHDQTNLGVHVVSQTHGLQEQEGTEKPDRQRQDHGQRQDKALVLPDQHQIDEGDDDDEDINCLIPLSCLVVSETRPADVETARQHIGIGADLLDRLNGLTGAVARQPARIEWRRRCTGYTG